MGFIKGALDSGFTGKEVTKVGSAFSGGADKAAKKAGQIQADSASEAIRFQRENLATTRADLQPFRDAGVEQLDPLSNLVSDPKAQLDYIQSNPFFEALADDAQNRLFANQAAKGKVGSGGTAEALQNSLLLLGQGLLDKNIEDRFRLVGMGQNAAAGQATATQNAGANITNLITDRGNALAAGEVGQANARMAGFNNSISFGGGIGSIVGNVIGGVTGSGGGGGGGISLSDIRAKRDVSRIGTADNGLPLYRFRYLDDDQVHIGVMAQDVEQVNPEAVIEVDGLKHVDYGALWQ